jgi:hypothetical protein
MLKQKYLVDAAEQMHMKSLRITARSEYGQNRIRYKFFENRKNDEFKSIVLRNSGNDWNITMLRDAIITTISKDRMDLDYQEYQPAVVFINGEYWGIHNIRERIDKHFPANIYKNVEADGVDVLERNGEIIDGDTTEYNQLIRFITDSSLANESNYATVANQIDINNYIDYMIIQIYVANTDWPGNNIKYWREKQDGKWRWILFDTDFGYGIWGDNPPDMNSLREALSPNGPGWPNPPWSTLMMRKLLENEGFKTQFLQRFAYHIHSTFSTERVEYIIDSLSSVINDEMYYHIERWGQPWDINAWYNNLDYIVTWNNDRTWYMMEHLMSRFRIANSHPVYIASDNENASVRMNDRKIKLPYSGEFFEGVPLVLSAQTKNEVYFDHWQVNSSFGNEFFVTQGDTWKYNDMGVELPNDWKNIDYNENTWNSGTAPLGYSNSNDESTRLSYGADAENKHTTYYFRKSFNITNISSYSDFMLDIAVDDGAVVYINGLEAVRQNMPEGAISYNTLTTSFDSNDGKVFSYYSISSNMFREGQNTIAVEVHQTSLNSSDVRFDARLLATYFLDTDQYVIYSNPWDINLNGSMAITLKTTNTPPIVTITEPLCNKIDNKTIVYPNPTKGIINIEGIDKNSKVTVKDILGKTIFSAHENRIDISQYPTGIYSVEILNNNSLQIFKVSKE